MRFNNPLKFKLYIYLAKTVSNWQINKMGVVKMYKTSN